LITHDLVIPIVPSEKIETRHLRCVLVTPSSVSNDKIQSTLDRIEHLASITGGVSIAIILLLSSPQGSEPTDPTGVCAYSTLSSALFSQADIASVPILPVNDAASIPEVIQAFMNGLKKGREAAVAAPSVRPIEVLPYCSTTQLDQHSTFLLTDVFESVKDMAASLTDSPRGKVSEERMAELLGPDIAKAVTEFWKDEWTAD
jgi:hypothetical protein